MFYLFDVVTCFLLLDLYCLKFIEINYRKNICIRIGKYL